LEDTQQHFAPYKDKAEVYFSMRLETCILGKLAFRQGITNIASRIPKHVNRGGNTLGKLAFGLGMTNLASRIPKYTDRGGELVAIVHKQ
jgi:hypothetical protein